MYSEGLASRDEKTRRASGVMYLWVLSPMHDLTGTYPAKIYTHLKLTPSTTFELAPMARFNRHLWAPSAQIGVLRLAAELSSRDLDARTRNAVMCEYLAMVIHEGVYDARCRTGFRELGKMLGMSSHAVYVHEYVAAFELNKRRKNAVLGRITDLEGTGSSHRWWKISGAAAAGGIVMACLMGITAPALIPAIGGLFSATATGAAGVGLPAAVTSGIGLTGSLFVATVTPLAVVTLFAGAGAGLAGYKVAIRTGSVEEMEYCRLVFEALELAVLPPPSIPPDTPLLPHDSNLHVTLCVAGWTLRSSSPEGHLRGPSLDAHELIWRQNVKHHYLRTLSEMYYVKWESRHLENFGELLSQTITTTIAKYGVGFWAVAAVPIITAVYATVLWPSWLLWSADLIDSSFSIAIDRAEKAGVLLADTLLHKAHGNRPVSLVAFSTGAVMVNSCLRELHARNAMGVIDDVFLFGSTTVINPEEWAKNRAIVCGRYVNVFSANDWFLAFLFRTTKFVTGIAGLQAVQVSGVENVDLSHMVDSHLSYIHKLGDLLAHVAEPRDPYLDPTFDTDKLVFQFSGSGVITPRVGNTPRGSVVHERPTSEARRLAREE